MQKKIKETLPYILVFFTAAALCAIILALKGLYPFGKQTVDYVDLSAMLSSFYAHFYDVLHGEKCYFFDWYTALGVNMSFASSGGSIFSVFNLFLYFVPRDRILESFSYYLMMQAGFMSVTMFFYLKQRHKAHGLITFLAAIGYGLCGFVLMNYTMISWLDFAVFVPLILYFSEEVFRSGKMVGLIVTLALGLAGNFYLSAMLLLFMFLEAGLYTILYKKREGIAKFGCSVAAAGLLSAFATLPQVMQTVSSSRFQNGESGGSLLGTYKEILSGGAGGYTTRWWVLLNVSLAGAVILIGLWKDLKNRNKRLILVGSSLLFVLLSLLFEGVAMLWHMGSYDNYPMRYGFLVYFVFAASLCAYEPEVVTAEEIVSVSKYKWLPVLSVVTLALAFAGRMWYFTHPGLSVSYVLHLTFICIGGAFFVYLFLALFKKGKYITLAAFLFVAELLFYGVLLIGQPTYITGYSEEVEHEGESVRICGQLSDAFDFDAERIDRIKNPDESLNVNYGIFLKQPALSNLTHLLSPTMQSNVVRLGYSIHFTRLLDAGGTVFSDALLNVKQVISCIDQDPQLYEKEKETRVVADHLSGKEATYGLYACKYTIPFGAISVSTAEAEQIRNAGDMVSLYNALFHAAWPRSREELPAEPFASYVACDEQNPCETGKELQIPVSGKQALYLYAPCADAEYRNLEIFVNGKPVIVPSLQETDNVFYPAHFNNNTVYLGTFENEDARVLLQMDASVKDYPVRMFTMDLNLLDALCDLLYDRGAVYTAGSHSLSVMQTAEDDYLMLPVAYDEGWRCKVNGQKKELQNLMDVFTLVPAGSGNNVEMVYYPKGFFLGIVLSIFGLFLTIAMQIFGKRIFTHLFDQIAAWTLMILWIPAILILFVIPVGYAIFMRFSQDLY